MFEQQFQSPLTELTNKGGRDNPMEYEGQYSTLKGQSRVGKLEQSDGRQGPLIVDNGYQLNIFQSKTANGYHPVTLITKALARIEQSAREANPKMGILQKRKRPTYLIDPRVEQKVDEVFREVIRPRLSLLDSEGHALTMLERAARIRPGLYQLPMEDKFLDRAYSLLDAQQQHAQLMMKTVDVQNVARRISAARGPIRARDNLQYANVPPPPIQEKNADDFMGGGKDGDKYVPPDVPDGGLPDPVEKDDDPIDSDQEYDDEDDEEDDQQDPRDKPAVPEEEKKEEEKKQEEQEDKNKPMDDKGPDQVNKRQLTEEELKKQQDRLNKKNNKDDLDFDFNGMYNEDENQQPAAPV